jgi:hypothetical protein
VVILDVDISAVGNSDVDKRAYVAEGSAHRVLLQVLHEELGKGAPALEQLLVAAALRYGSVL